MLGEFSRKQETNGGLNFTGCEGLGVVVGSKLSRLGGDALEEISDKGVHDAHGLGRDTGVRMNLLEHLVDVDGVGFTPLLLAGSLFGSGGHTLLCDLLLSDRDRFAFGSHCECECVWRMRVEMVECVLVVCECGGEMESKVQLAGGI